MNKAEFMEMAENMIQDYIQSHGLHQNHAIPCTIYPVWLSNNLHRPMGLFSTSLRDDIYYECKMSHYNTFELRVFIEAEKIQKEV